MEVIRAVNLSKIYRTHEKPEASETASQIFFTESMQRKKRYPASAFP